MTENTARTWRIFGIAATIAGIIIIFFSGIFPVENLFTRALPSPCSQPAAVVAADVVTLTNENRVSSGVPALATSALLTQAAQEKADDMATYSYYAHISPDGKSPLYWLQKVGYTYLNAGENLVIDRTTSEQAVDAWMASTEHRDNILRPQFTEIGVGVAQGEYQGIPTTFVVQEFGTPYPVRAPVVATAVKPQAITTTAVSVVNIAAVPVHAAPAIPAKPDALTKGSAALSTPVASTLHVTALIPSVSNTSATATNTASTSLLTLATDVRYAPPLAATAPINLSASPTDAPNCAPQ